MCPSPTINRDKKGWNSVLLVLGAFVYIRINNIDPGFESRQVVGF
jgi:hypothetical protein